MYMELLNVHDWKVTFWKELCFLSINYSKKTTVCCCQMQLYNLYLGIDK